MYCTNCGSDVSSKDKFCFQCGSSTDLRTHSSGSVALGGKHSISNVPAIALVFLMLLAAFGGITDYDFFTFLRWAAFSIASYYAYIHFRNRESISDMTIIFSAVAVVFNPFVPIYLDRDTWQIIDVIIAILAGIYSFSLRKLVQGK